MWQIVLCLKPEHWLPILVSEFTHFSNHSLQLVLTKKDSKWEAAVTTRTKKKKKKKNREIFFYLKSRSGYVITFIFLGGARSILIDCTISVIFNFYCKIIFGQAPSVAFCVFIWFDVVLVQRCGIMIVLLYSLRYSFGKYSSAPQGCKVQRSSQPIGSRELLLPGKAGSERIRLVHFEWERGFI